MIRLPLPEQLVSAAPGSAVLHAWLTAECQRRSGFVAALDLECQPPSRTARLEAIAIIGVRIDKSVLHVSYRVTFTEFAACQDLTREFIFERHLTGRLEENHVEFPEPFRAPMRDTADEF